MWHFNSVGLLRQCIEWLEAGEKNEAEIVEICLARIREREDELRTWSQICDQVRQTGGPLRGIPFGAKDIFETEGLATEYGSPLYAGRKGSCNAALVRDLKQRGAVLLGKTHTTAFAYFDPAPTRNPHNIEHTPGGSSSGSAAAVAAGMVPFALGSQTQGSIIRPASYCGVVGFKPSFGCLPREGMLPFAPSLDTAGLFTQTAEDMRLLWERLGFAVDAEAPARFKIPANLPDLNPLMAQAFRDAAARLGAQAIELPPEFGDLLAAGRLINDYEGARTHEARWREHGAAIGSKLAELVARGLAIPAESYAAALETVRRLREQMAEVFRRAPVILTPAAPGPAPRGLASTGDPRMNTPWTALGVPAISVPLPVAGLPLGLQLTAGAGDEATLLAAAVRSEVKLSAGGF